MGLFKMAAVGAMGYFAYQALQRKQNGGGSLGNDRGNTGDQRLGSDVSDTSADASPGSVRASQGNSAP